LKERCVPVSDGLFETFDFIVVEEALAASEKCFDFKIDFGVRVVFEEILLPIADRFNVMFEDFEATSPSLCLFVKLVLDAALNCDMDNLEFALPSPLT